MRVIIICILFLFYFQSAEAQNLIADSSFEKNKFVPIDFSSLNASYTWAVASQGTTDLFCRCNKKKRYSLVDVPQNPMGYQEPHSGTCYAGLFAFSHGYYREYLQSRLTEPLEKNKIYLFTMYISLADYSRAHIDQLGVCFLTKEAGYNSANVITNLKPAYIKIEDEVGKDVKDWHRVTVKYRAKGGELYVLIGSFEVNKINKTKFKPPKEIKARTNQSRDRDAYYYIDDVSVVETAFVEPVDTISQSYLDSLEKIQADTAFILKNVLFETNEIILLAPSCAELDLIVAYLNQHMDAKIEIVGHTDNSGNGKANRKLSTGRAKSVSEYLSTKGIDKNRITYLGVGSLKPIASNESEEGKQQNRRVEFIIR